MASLDVIGLTSQAVDKAFVADVCKSTNVNLEFDLEVLDKVQTSTGSLSYTFDQSQLLTCSTAD